MAFDLSPFDLSGFDIGGSSTILISILVQEKVLAQTGTSQEVYINASASERLTVPSAIVGNGQFLTPEFLETVSSAEANGEFSVILSKMVAGEIMDAVQAAARSVSCIDIIAVETGTGQAEYGADICVKPKAYEIVAGTAYTDKNRWLVIQSYELMSGNATLEAVDIEVCELNIRLEPGQRLVIDAGNYNILLDGENAIECQRGVWIDELTRETSSISITAASGVGNLSASILYTEQYL